MSVDDPVLNEVARLLDPILERHDARLYDLERNGGILRITIERDGGIDLEALTDVNRSLGRALDESDPIPGAYTLEVSSPGLERTLRTDAHWAGAVGEQVKVKLDASVDEPRRLEGTVAAVADGVVSLIDGRGETVTFDLATVERARTVFEWGPQPKPGGPKAGGSKQGGSTSTRAASADDRPGATAAGADEDAVSTQSSAPDEMEDQR
jgi:ribosome maturation factor RimP